MDLLSQTSKCPDGDKGERGISMTQTWSLEQDNKNTSFILSTNDMTGFLMNNLYAFFTYSPK